MHCDEQPHHKHKAAVQGGTSEAVLLVFLVDCLRHQQNAPVSQMSPIIILSPSEKQDIAVAGSHIAELSRTERLLRKHMVRSGQLQSQNT